MTHSRLSINNIRRSSLNDNLCIILLNYINTSETRITKFDPTFTAGVMAVVLGMVGSASYDLIKTLIQRVLERKGVSNPNIQQQGKSASGALVTVTTVEEK